MTEEMLNQPLDPGQPGQPGHHNVDPPPAPCDHPSVIMTGYDELHVQHNRAGPQRYIVALKCTVCQANLQKLSDRPAEELDATLADSKPHPEPQGPK